MATFSSANASIAIAVASLSRMPAQISRRMARKESKIQQMCVRYFRIQYPQIGNLLFSVPNGGSRILREAVTLKKEGVVAGVSDLILLFPSSGYHGLCIEMKTDDKSSRQSKSQKEWQQLVESAGYKYIICRNFDDFESEIKIYLESYLKSYFDL